MSSDWPYAKIGDLTVNLDTRRKPVKEADRKPGPFPYYGASGIVDHVDGYIFEGEHLLIAEDGENLRTRQTPIAFMASGRFWVNNHAHIVVGNEKASTRFLQYALLGTDISAYLTGAVMPKLTQGNLNRIEVPCPPRNIQEKIVGILGPLDDRIVLLRETNSTLESIAQSLFKSWFVDFDPVRAKLEGRAPEGMDEETAALFPDKFEESEVGSIPRGWQVCCLEDLLILQRGFDLPASARRAGSVPIIAASGPAGYHVEPMAKAPGVVTGRSGVLGRVFLVLDDYWPLNTSLWVKAFKKATPCYAFELLRRLDLASFNAGSAVPTLNRNHLHGLRQVLPSAACVAAYEDIAMSLHRRVKCYQEFADLLAKLRDSLLPRLISGQVRTREAEEQVSEALTGT
jgi:type I restriction enzyme, S subunit